MDACIDFLRADGSRLSARFAAPLKVLRADARDQVAGVLAAAEQASRAGNWVVGWVSYEAAPAIDPAFKVQSGGPQPLALFAVYSAAEAMPPPVEAASASFFCKHWASSLAPDAAAVRIEAIRHGIAAGDYYQINLTMRASSPFAGSPAALFSALTASQPGAFAAYFDWGDGQVLSVSPELFFERTGNTVITRPMKGTAPRHADPAADAAAAEHLRSSIKERAENLMIVDLLRNDLARIAETGSVQVPQLFAVEPWPTVWQMTSTISAQARAGVGLAELFGALFPCGSVTGAPKVAAMQAIAGLEDSPRGVYCGAIGVLPPGGDAVFSVVIRTVQIAQGRATCGLGSAITIDSTATAEYEEWIAKRRFLLRAAAPFDLLETLRLENGNLSGNLAGDLSGPLRGHFVRGEAHLQRLLNSAAWFGFAVRAEAVRDAWQALAEAHPAGVFRVRCLAGRDGAVRCEAFPLEPSPDQVLVRLAERPMMVGAGAGSGFGAADADALVAPEFLHHKTTVRAHYEAFASPPGVFDTLLFNEEGQLTEFTRGSVFLEQNGVLLTPPLACGLLPGVLRAELLASGRAQEAVLTPADLARGGQLWFGNSLRGLIPARLI